MALPVTVLPELTAPIDSVALDSGVLLRITKHTSESFPSIVSGLLLGLDADSLLQITYTFAFPPGETGSGSGSSGADDATNPRSKSNLRFQTDMIRQLKDVNIEVNPIGYYISSYLGGFFNQTLIDSLVGLHSVNPNSIVLVHDVTKSSQGGLALKAYRLSKSFWAAHKACNGKFSSESIIENELTHLDILEEVPLKVKNTHLATALLQSIDQPAFERKGDPTSLISGTMLTPNLDSLDLSIDPYLEKNAEFLIDSVDDYYAEQGTFNYYQRQLGREQTKIQQWIQKTRAENATRERARLPTVSEDDWSKHFKLPTEPSRLDNLLISAQINQYCNQIEEYAAVVSNKMFAIQNGLDA
ncbi:uncharacterized protein V1516DRAFT_697785 [Lipomyces oligophaga]|uniref:uncharacterized protein n=1 Tax=Lipomyces oligophaga TaxID=45792 RepID=UPI0034CF1DDC